MARAGYRATELGPLGFLSEDAGWIASALRARGLELAGAVEREAQIDRMLAETDVTLCFDTGHHAFWDQDVLAYMDRIWDRIGVMHLKNVNPVVRARVLAGSLGVNASFDQGVMSALSEGAVDIGAVMRKLVARGFDGYCIVEQDPPNDAALTPEALARRNLAFLAPWVGG